MSERPRYRAWRFVHPDFDVPGASAGLRISARGRIDMVEEQDSVRQAILMLLSTAPGERVMRPDYGCDLQRLVFSPNDDTTAGLAIHYVRLALERWEPRIEVLQLDADRNAERPELLDILVEYRVRATQRVERLGLSLNLAGEED
jgi:phage baseplate assembly protein W